MKDICPACGNVDHFPKDEEGWLTCTRCGEVQFDATEEPA